MTEELMDQTIVQETFISDVRIVTYELDSEHQYTFQVLIYWPPHYGRRNQDVSFYAGNHAHKQHGYYVQEVSDFIEHYSGLSS